MSAWNGRDLLDLAERLRAGDPISAEEREFLADELQALAAKARGPGRPRETPAERGLVRRKRAIVAEHIYQGIFPQSLYPPELELSVKVGKKSRTEADAMAAEILGVSPRTIWYARTSIYGTPEQRPLMDRDRWEEFKAVLRHAFRNQSS
jgi:hypothetical protein